MQNCSRPDRHAGLRVRRATGTKGRQGAGWLGEGVGPHKTQPNLGVLDALRGEACTLQREGSRHKSGYWYAESIDIDRTGVQGVRVTMLTAVGWAGKARA